MIVFLDPDHWIVGRQSKLPYLNHHPEENKLELGEGVYGWVEDGVSGNLQKLSEKFPRSCREIGAHTRASSMTAKGARVREAQSKEPEQKEFNFGRDYVASTVSPTKILKVSRISGKRTGFTEM